MRELVKWDESLSVGVPIFDNQHKRLFEILNNLFNAIADKHSDDIIGGVILYLYEYAGTHFKDEEEEMLAVNYPEYEKHKNQHDQFLKKVKEFISNFHSGNDITVELFNFIKDWIFQHIIKEDRKYSSYFEILVK